MPRKLAIVISGAVSLGSYEAGVMYEVLEAIALHNESVGADHPERVEIDVITGASAGAMTAAILSRQLYYGGKALRIPYHGNPLFNAWVQNVSIDQLLSVHTDEHRYSLLSSAVIDEIGRQSIPDEPGLAMDPHPAAAQTLQVGFAMSNLNGYKQEIPGSGGNESFAYSRYKDQFVCRLQRRPPELDQHDSPTSKPGMAIHLTELEPQLRGRKVVWEPIHNTCRWGILREMALSSGAFPFAFRARRIVRSGGSKNSMMSTRDSSIKSTSGDKLHGGDYLYTDGGVFENEPVGMAANLTEILDAGHADADRSYLFVAPGKRTIDADPFFNKEDDLVAMATGLVSAIFGQSRFQQWVSEGLTGKLLTVTATEASLIGDTFSAFAGFLEYDFRAHDYNIGRRNARQKLRDGAFDHLIKDYTSLDKKMRPIDWPEDEQSRYNSSTLASLLPTTLGDNKETPDRYGECETELWKAVCQRYATLAKPLIRQDSHGRRKRDQGRELRNLMMEVDESRRALIAQQVYDRVDSLVDFFNSKYLDPIDAKRRSGIFWWLLRQTIGKRATKIALKWSIRSVIKSYILHPMPSSEPEST